MTFKSQLYLSILLIAIIVMGLFFFSICPTFSNIKQDSQNLLINKEELASIEYLTKSFEDFEKNFELYEDGLKEMEGLLSKESLIDPEIPIEFINFLKEQSQELDLSLKIIPLQDKNKIEEHWNALKFRVTGVGRVDHVRTFIEKIENSKWLLGIVDLTATTYKEGAEVSSRNYISINLTVKIYAQD